MVSMSNDSRDFSLGLVNRVVIQAKPPKIIVTQTGTADTVKTGVRGYDRGWVK